jgi:hypothetical protein
MLDKKKESFFVIGFYIPSLLSVIPFLTGDYREDEVGCAINGDSWRGIILEFVIITIPASIFVFATFYFTYKIAIHLYEFDQAYRELK